MKMPNEIKLVLILIKELKTKKQNSPQKECYRCDLSLSTKHINECKALKAKYSNCNK